MACKVKRGGVGHGLDRVGARHHVLQRNRRPVRDVDELREGIAEVRVSFAPIAQPPARIHVELIEVGQAFDFRRTRRLAARQRAENI